MNDENSPTGGEQNPHDPYSDLSLRRDLDRGYSGQIEPVPIRSWTDLGNLGDKTLTHNVSSLSIKLPRFSSPHFCHDASGDA